MIKKPTRVALSALLGLALAMTPAVAHATSETPVGGALVAQGAHELPAPDVALASDGRSLVVYQSADPSGVIGECGSSGGDCSIVGQVVAADGVTAGEPFLVSGDATSDSYYAAPSVVWNEDRNEWLVLFTAGYETLYAQRVSAAGELEGERVLLPSAVSLPGDRSSLIDVTVDDHAHARASWSSADQAYLLTWYAETDMSVLELVGRQAIFGYLMNGDLTSADGRDAAFVISDTVNPQNQNVKTGYSAELDTWEVLWNSSSTQVRAQGVSFDGVAPQVDESQLIIDSTEEGYYTRHLSGGVVWIDSRGSWLFSWSARPTVSDPMEAYGRFFSAAGLGPVFPISDHGVTRTGSVVNGMRSHQLAYDAATDTVHAAGMIESFAPAFDEYVYTAVHWTFDPAALTPGETTELISPDVEGILYASSRARLSTINGGIAVTYQNWPAGIYMDPSEVRYLLVSSPAVEEPADPELPVTPVTPETPVAAELAATGADSVSGLLIAASTLLGLGVVASVAVRRRAVSR